ncbi:MAG: Mur ligase family protein [Candidatus Dojkabacteria bacterium]|nr:Mur ligase family protein [Candidatus Dojkabacteria bacterium]
MLSQLVKRVHSHHSVKVIGIAGTRGKTITAHILFDLLKTFHDRVALFSSIGYDIFTESGNDFSIHDATSTDIKELLKRLVAEKVDYLILEVTSKNLKKGIYDDIKFDAGIITNIYDDNIEYYKASAEYINTKISFLKKFKDYSTLIFASDIENILLNHSFQLRQNIVYDTFSLQNDISNFMYLEDGIQFVIANNQVKTNTYCIYNLQNLLASIMLLKLLLNTNINYQLLNNIRIGSGRIDVLRYNGAKVVIDFSYKPDMLQLSLEHFISIRKPGSRIIAVGGSQGRKNIFDRSIGKVLAKLVDIVILVPNDPKDESVEDINMQIFKYAENEKGVIVEDFISDSLYQLMDKSNLIRRINTVLEHGNKPFILFNSNNLNARYNGIDLALKLAQPNDIVYVFGKGGQQYMEMENAKQKWSDYDTIFSMINAR